MVKNNIVQTTVTVKNASTAVLAANANRKFALFINDSDTVIYLNLGSTATANNGIRVNASGGEYEMSVEKGNLYTGAVYGINGSGDKIMLVLQGS